MKLSLGEMEALHKIPNIDLVKAITMKSNREKEEEEFITAVDTINNAITSSAYNGQYKTKYCPKRLTKDKIKMLISIYEKQGYKITKEDNAIVISWEITNFVDDMYIAGMAR